MRPYAHEDQPVSVGLVGCGRLASSSKAPARDLYTGEIFRLALKHASHEHHEVYILSPCHHLLDPDARVHAYDRTLVELTWSERRSWARRVVGQLATLFPVRDIDLWAYASSYYTNPLVNAISEENFTWKLWSPLRGLALPQRFMWFQNQWTTRISV